MRGAAAGRESVRFARGVWLIGVLLLSLAPGPASAQRLSRAAIGGGVGIAGGVAVTMATIMARARFQNEYLHAPEDLIHWQSTPMIAAPAAGVFFGWTSEDALRGSIVGSLAGLAVGAGIGTGLGWLLSEEAESPWAGGVIGGGAGLAIGGLLGGFLAWREEDAEGEPSPPALAVFRVPL